MIRRLFLSRLMCARVDGTNKLRDVRDTLGADPRVKALLNLKRAARVDKQARANFHCARTSKDELSRVVPAQHASYADDGRGGLLGDSSVGIEDEFDGHCVDSRATQATSHATQLWLARRNVDCHGGRGVGDAKRVGTWAGVWATGRTARNVDGGAGHVSHGDFASGNGAELDEQARARKHRAHFSQELLQQFWVGGKLAALMDIWATDIELDGGKAASSIDSTGNANIVFDAEASNAGDDRATDLRDARGVVLDEYLDTWVGKPNGIEHASLERNHAPRLVAIASEGRDAFGNDPANAR